VLLQLQLLASLGLTTAHPLSVAIVLLQPVVVNRRCIAEHGALKSAAIIAAAAATATAAAATTATAAVLTFGVFSALPVSNRRLRLAR
jgi:hypothetical protein